jgi:hypothetical protein
VIAILLALKLVQHLGVSTVPYRPRRLARPRTPPFHGDNMGSNPIGDAKYFNNLGNLCLLP